WTPTVADANYRIGVWARSAGVTTDTAQAAASIPFAIMSAPPSFTGVWSGPTAQAQSVTFAVGTGGVTPMLTYRATCLGIVALDLFRRPATGITNGTFSLGVAAAGGWIGTISGTFDTSTHASGSMAMTSPSCPAVNTTWSSDKHPDQGPQVVTVVATDPTAAELGPNTGTFTITRSGATTYSLPISYSLAGTASSSDYTVSTPSPG